MRRRVQLFVQRDPNQAPFSLDPVMREHHFRVHRHRGIPKKWIKRFRLNFLTQKKPRIKKLLLQLTLKVPACNVVACPNKGHSLSVFMWPHCLHLRHRTFFTAIPKGWSDWHSVFPFKYFSRGAFFCHSNLKSGFSFPMASNSSSLRRNPAGWSYIKLKPTLAITRMKNISGFSFFFWVENSELHIQIDLWGWRH